MLWKKTKHFSGISEDYFYSYFQNKDAGYAIKIGKTTIYQNPQNIEERFGVKPPQSFVYIN
jgi:predicted transcriptional regulator